MYQCNKCGGNVRFDIAKQMLKCDYCDELLDPYSVEKEEDASASVYDANVFICPQCGAQLLSEDTAAADFCSYCGASAILTSRVSKKRKPDSIVPFKKTKDECKNLFRKEMKKAIFAPNELKDIDSLEGFRGIYMPYWSYNITQKKELRLNGVVETEEYGTGFRYRQTAVLTGKLDAQYSGIAHDSSSAFRDEYSERIAPFSIEDVKPFTPSYLSGFYADVDDVSPETYENEVRKIVNNRTYEHLMAQDDSKLFGLSVGYSKMDKAFGTKVTSQNRALFPVWFMSFRKGKRVAYATVNGQTGKIASDMPVDYGKFAFGTAVVAALLFLIFNMFFTFKPEVALLVASLLTLVSAVIYNRELDEIIIKDNRLDDRGFLSKISKLKEYVRPGSQKIVNIYFDKGSIIFILLGVVIPALFIYYMVYIYGAEVFGAFRTFQTEVYLTVFVIMLKLLYSIFKKITKLKEKRFFGPGCFALFMVVSLIIFIWNPVDDIYYYIGIAAALSAALGGTVSIIGYYNVLSTRELPQFETHKGGDDDAF